MLPRHSVDLRMPGYRVRGSPTGAIGQYVLLPWSKTRLVWDLLAVLFLAYIAVAMPYRLAFMDLANESPQSFLPLLDLIIDIFFLLDILLNFNTAYYAYRGELRVSRREIAAHYLRTWLFLDLVASVPFDRLDTSRPTGASGASGLVLLRLLKFGKMLRLIRLLRLGKRFDEFGRDILADVHYLITRILNSNVVWLSLRLVTLLFLIHWNGCVQFFLIGGRDVGIMNTRTNHTYAVSLARVTVQMYGGGVGATELEDPLECWLYIFSAILGIASITWLVASFATKLYADLNHAGKAYREKVETLEEWMKGSRLPTSMRVRLRTYFEVLYPGALAFNENSIMQELSLPLQQEVSEFKAQGMLKALGIAQSWSAGLAGAVSMELTRHVHLKDDVLIHEGRSAVGLFFVTKGIVLIETFMRDEDSKLIVDEDGNLVRRQVAQLTEGHVMGEMTLLQPEKLSTATATVASVHCEVHKLAKTVYSKLVTTYPELKSYLEKIAEARNRQNSTRRRISVSASNYIFDAFLAHTWAEDDQGRNNHARVAEVNRALKVAGLSTWFDEERMAGDINLQMADGIDKSHVVLAFITRAYMEKVNGEGPNSANDNAKFEFDYALLKKGVSHIIPVVMEPGCKDTKQWTGVVGGKLGPRLYIDCSDELTPEKAEQIAGSIIQLIAEREQPRANELLAYSQERESAVEELERLRDGSPRNSVITDSPEGRGSGRGSRIVRSLFSGGSTLNTADTAGDSFSRASNITRAAVRLQRLQEARVRHDSDHEHQQTTDQIEMPMATRSSSDVQRFASLRALADSTNHAGGVSAEVPIQLTLNA